MKLRARSIRSQLILGLVVLEELSMLLFGVVLVRTQRIESRQRAELRLQHQAASLVLQVETALRAGQPNTIPGFVTMLANAPSVGNAKITDPGGRIVAQSGLPVRA